LDIRQRVRQKRDGKKYMVDIFLGFTELIQTHWVFSLSGFLTAILAIAQAIWDMFLISNSSKGGPP